MKHHFCTNLGAAFLILAATGSVDGLAESNHYRWQNSSGETVFSDQPPPGGETYEVISNPTSLQPVTTGLGDSPQATESPKGNSPQATESGEGESKSNAEFCRRAKMNLAKLDGTDKVSVRNEKGEVHELSPQERTVMQQTAKAKIEVYCQ